jgi:hypothetical protein
MKGMRFIILGFRRTERAPPTQKADRRIIFYRETDTVAPEGQFAFDQNARRLVSSIESGIIAAPSRDAAMRESRR